MSHQATNWAFGLRGLKPAAKLILLALADCHNPSQGCYPSQSFLAEACELNRDTVNVHLAALEAAGLIRRTRSVDPKTKRQRSTRYKLAFEPDFDTPDSAAVEPAKRRAQRPEAGRAAPRAVSEFPAEPCRNFGQSRVGISDTNLVREPVMRTCVRGEGAAIKQNGFEEFEKAHPRMRDRQRSQELFEEAVAAGVSGARIIQAARRYRGDQAGNKPMYVAYSDNWLMQRRWEDYPEDAIPPIGSSDVGATAAFWAKKVKAGAFIPSSAISGGMAKAMIAANLVTEVELRRAGVSV